MEEKKLLWYCVSYETATAADGSTVDPECDFIQAYTDEDAIEQAKELAAMGKDYSDCGHVNLSLLSVCECDPEQEWEDVRTVWF